MVSGWLADHEWRPMGGALAMALLAAAGVGHTPASPLGEGYAGLDLAGLSVLIMAAGFALGLRSALSRSLAIRERWQPRALWLALSSCALVTAVVAGLGPSRTDLPRVVNLCATTGFVAAGAAIVLGEGAALAHVFCCAALTVATPRAGGHLPWWSPLLNDSGGAPRLALSCVVIAAVCTAYLSVVRMKNCTG